MRFFNLIRKSVLPISGASSIEVYDGKIFIVGDDSPTLYVTDKSWKREESVVLMPEKKGRIPKMEKMDLEATTLIKNPDGSHSLLITGSASMPGREVVIVAPIDNLIDFTKYDCSLFFNRLRTLFGLSSINIEGMTNVENKYLILACRGSQKHPQNYLFVVPINFYRKQISCFIKLVRLNLPKNIGISGLSFWGNNKAMFTATVEHSTDSIQDGEIGDSYFGWLNVWPTANSVTDTLSPAFIANLSKYSRAFCGEKVESVAIAETQQNRYLLHFVSDNDNGVSHIFEAELNL